MVVVPTLELDSEESDIPSISFGISNENKSNEFISKMALTHLLKHWRESKTWSHSSYTSISPSEHMYLKLFYIILKYNKATDFYSQIYIHSIE